MVDPIPGFLAYGLLAVFLLVGLFVHERTGLRLGGAIVLPLLLVYTLFDLNVLVIFAFASLLAFLIGTVVHNRTLVYGRRMFILFLVLGVLATAIARLFIPTDVGGFALAVVPGVFAFNLHREGHYLRAASTFLLWFGLLLALGSLLLWMLGGRGDDPAAVPSAFGWFLGLFVAAISHAGAALPWSVGGAAEGAALLAAPLRGLGVDEPAQVLNSLGGLAVLLEGFYASGGGAE
jgi:hypothetical protein